MSIKDIRGIPSSFERYVTSVALAANDAGDYNTVRLANAVLQAPDLRTFMLAVNVLEARMQELEAGTADDGDESEDDNAQDD